MLARLLGPQAFGVYAVALTFLGLIQTFNDLGLSLAIVRWENDPREIVPTVATVSVSVSAIIYAGCFFAAPAYASAMGAPAASSVVRVLAVAILIDGFATTPNGLLQRRFQQGRRMIAVQAGWLGTGVTVALALSGYGAMSLALGQLAGCVMTTILLIRFAPDSMRFGLNRAKATVLLRFGLPLAGANLISFALNGVDRFVVGHTLGAVALGYYVLAFNLATWPLNLLSRPIRNVFPAIFSRVQHDGAAMHRTFLRAVGVLASATLPACLLISGSARPLIGFFYGARWQPADRPLIWLSALAAMGILFEPAYDYLVVLVKTRFVLIVQIVWLLALMPAVIVGTRAAGLYGTGLAEAAVAACVILPCYLGGLRSTGLSLSRLGDTLWLPTVGGLVSGLVAAGASRILTTDFIALIASGLATVAVIGFLLYHARSTLFLLRPPTVELSEPTAGLAPAVVSSVSDTPAPIEGATEDVAPLRRGPQSPGNQHGMPPDGHRGFQDAFFTGVDWSAATSPLPILPDIGPDTQRHEFPTSPLYWGTVASLRLDPAKTPHRESIKDAFERPSQ